MEVSEGRLRSRAAAMGEALAELRRSECLTLSHGASMTRKIIRAALLFAMITLPGCLVVTCGP